VPIPRRSLSKLALATALLLPLLAPSQGLAASCCGGGGGGALVLPKMLNQMVSLTTSAEIYDGYWDLQGHWTADPAGSDLAQYRTSLGYALRLSDNLQGSVSLPYVLNRNRYSGLSRNTQGLGDTSLSLSYEFFDEITCVYQVRDWADLFPAIYLTVGLTVPTGLSPYGDLQDNFDITGRGFYRLDTTLTVEKSVWPWSVGMTVGYGRFLARSINREYAQWVAPYTKRLGDRVNASLSLGYTLFMNNSDATVTTTLAYSGLREEQAIIDGQRDPLSGMRRQSFGVTVSRASTAINPEWVVKGSFQRAPRWSGWGVNFPTTDTFSLGVNHAW